MTRNHSRQNQTNINKLLNRQIYKNTDLQINENNSINDRAERESQMLEDRNHNYKEEIHISSSSQATTSSGKILYLLHNPSETAKKGTYA